MAVEAWLALSPPLNGRYRPPIRRPSGLVVELRALDLRPQALGVRSVTLLPLEPHHAEDLFAPSIEGDVWRYMPIRVESLQDLRSFLQSCVATRVEGKGLGFAIRHEPCGRLVGMTGFWQVSPEHRRLEIGATWVARDHQRSEVNTECKRLLLSHAFEVLDCLRVEFKTDARNGPSRAALARIGAVEEGTLRRHMVLSDGSFRDSVYFSILSEEWPEVRSKLDTKLQHPPFACAPVAC